MTATDDSAAMASITHTVTLTIADDPTDGVTPAPDGMTPAPGASNEAPETTTLAETSLTATEGEAATWTVSGWFADPDAGDTLTYAATLQKTDAAMAAGLPDWLVLNAMTGSLTIASGRRTTPRSASTRWCSRRATPPTRPPCTRFFSRFRTTRPMVW